MPREFATDACFDGLSLLLRNNLSIALTPDVDGDLQLEKTKKTDFGLAALATRAVAEETLLLPGDTLTFRAGVESSTTGVRGSRHGGFYALATTAATFIPGRPATVVNAFTGLVRELDDVFAQYRDCLEGKNWLAQLGCRALFVRNVEFALGRATVSGLAKGVLEVILSGATFTKWADAQVPDVRKVIESEPISLGDDPARVLAVTSTCEDWYSTSIPRRDEFAGSHAPLVELVTPPPNDEGLREAFMYGFVYGQCDRAKKQGINPTLDRTLRAEFPGDG